jgi:hypothetical protein
MHIAHAAAITAALLLVATSGARAQGWSLEGGGLARGEYTDNYFFTADERESALTASLAPFLSAVRRTEASEFAALVAPGVNKVWGSSSDAGFLTGRLAVSASLRGDDAVWSGSASLARDRSLQSQDTAAGIVFAVTARTSTAVDGTYSAELTERWTAAATLSGYANRYEAVESGTSLQDNSGYTARVRTAYAYSDRTQVTLSSAASHFNSDVSRGKALSATLGIARQWSPQLLASATLGGYLSWIDAVECAATTCAGATAAPLDRGARGRHGGLLYGANLTGSLSERSRVSAGFTSDLSPSSSGTLVRTHSAGISLSRDLSERASGRIGARTVLDRSLDRASRGSYYAMDASATYRLGERWALDAGYTYARARYSQRQGDPRSNAVFVSIGYNWAGVSLADRRGTFWDTGALSGTPSPFAPPGSASPITPLGSPSAITPPGSAPAPATPLAPERSGPDLLPSP